MFHFDLPICPCCTGAMLYTLAQTSANWSNPQLFLELGKGALVAAIGSPAPVRERAFDIAANTEPSCYSSTIHKG